MFFWYSLKKKIRILLMLYNIGENHIFVPTFSGDSHFGPYLLFSLLLVPI